MKEKINLFISTLNPLLLYAGAYIIALTFSVIVCLSLFNKYNDESTTKGTSQSIKTNELITSGYKISVTALRIK